jgi:glycosyltransferase involved in cell wall biosynthesis
VTTISGAGALRDTGWPGLGIRVLRLPCEDGQRARRQIAEQIMLPRVARQLGADVVHSLASVAPIQVPGIAHVITLHDVNFIHHRTFNPVTSWGMRQVIPRAARHADALIAGSATARDDVCATLGLSAERFTVVPHGAQSPHRMEAADPADLRARFSLGAGPVILCVGAQRPHKNQALLLRALCELPADVRLVLAGRAEPYAQTLRALARELDLDDRVVFAGWVDDEDLEGLWALAQVAAVPTLAEGFGMPVLEAMARGVPVAASDLPVIHEVADDCPAYFNPQDPHAAAQAIARLLTEPPDPAPAQRRAATFTWSAAAEATWAVYDRALEARGEATALP